MPKLLLLTVCANPGAPCEEVFDIREYETGMEKINSLLTSDAISLDGVYIEYQACMLHDDTAGEKLRRLCNDMCVGLWGYDSASELHVEYPDTLRTVRKFVGDGVTFVNSDSPTSFF